MTSGSPIEGATQIAPVTVPTLRPATIKALIRRGLSLMARYMRTATSTASAPAPYTPRVGTATDPLVCCRVHEATIWGDSWPQALREIVPRLTPLKSLKTRLHNVHMIFTLEIYRQKNIAIYLNLFKWVRWRASLLFRGCRAYEQSIAAFVGFLRNNGPLIGPPKFIFG